MARPAGCLLTIDLNSRASWTRGTGRVEEDPEWMISSGADSEKKQAKTQEDFQRWKEQMKAKDTPADEKPELKDETPSTAEAAPPMPQPSDKPSQNKSQAQNSSAITAMTASFSAASLSYNRQAAGAVQRHDQWAGQHVLWCSWGSTHGYVVYLQAASGEHGQVGCCTAGCSRVLVLLVSSAHDAHHWASKNGDWLIRQWQPCVRP